MSTFVDSSAETTLGGGHCLHLGGSARAIAEAYLDEVTAFWRGTSERRPLQDWLASYWHDTMPPLPNCPSAAISPHGAGGRGIVWYEVEKTVLGYIPGLPGGYQVPDDERIPTAIGPDGPAQRAISAPTTAA